MSIQASAVNEQETEVEKNFPGDLYFLTIPADTYKALSDVAAKRGMTVAQAMQAAFRGFLSETLPPTQGTPKLLTERDKRTL